LVLAGGGIMGAAYEIGSLTALDRFFTGGFSSRRFDIYVGVSAGSVIATLIANRIPPSGLFRAIVNNETSAFNWRRRDIYRFNYKAVLSSCWGLGKNLVQIFRHYRQRGWPFSFNDLFYVLQEQFPAGIFSLDPLQQYLCQAFRQEGILDDFHQIQPELYIPSYDLDLGRRVVFGAPGYRDLHICEAITASCAIPYFFQPYKIGRSHYLDGSIGRVSHLDIAVERGAKLILVINPRVPMNNDPERFCLPSLSSGQCSSIADLGITFSWEQSQRIENKEKLDMALATHRREHPDVDIVLFEPGREESLLFFQSPMSQTARNQIMEYGYHLTVLNLQENCESLRKTFAKHGIKTRTDRMQEDPPNASEPEKWDKLQSEELKT